MSQVHGSFEYMWTLHAFKILSSPRGFVVFTAQVVSASITALEAAADLAPPDASTLQKVGRVCAAALSSGSAGTQDKSTLNQSADVLGTVLSTAATATAVVTEDAGNAMLSCLFIIVTANSDGGGDAVASAFVTAKAVDLLSKLGQVMLNSVPTNGTTKLSSLDALGRGVETEVKKGSAEAAAQNGMLASLGARRLQENPTQPTCDEVGLQFTQWIASNPYSWANESVGINGYIASNATISVSELSRCGIVAGFGTSVEVPVQMPGDTAQVTDTPTCVIFDAGKGEWVTDNISLISANRDNFVAQCAATNSGSYAVYYRTKAFALDYLLVVFVATGSGLLGGFCLRKRSVEMQRRKNKVHPEEAPSLRDIVTEPPGDTDAERDSNTEGMGSEERYIGPGPMPLVLMARSSCTSHHCLRGRAKQCGSPSTALACLRRTSTSTLLPFRLEEDECTKAASEEEASEGDSDNLLS
eukprot:symbB.v1.2.010654.t1/scaffold698.1/size172485/3